MCHNTPHTTVSNLRTGAVLAVSCPQWDSHGVDRPIKKLTCSFQHDELCFLRRSPMAEEEQEAQAERELASGILASVNKKTDTVYEIVKTAIDNFYGLSTPCLYSAKSF
jgi:hypothetical protein